MTRFTITVPEQYNDSSPVSPDYFETFEQRLLNIAPGFTLTNSIGAWRDDSGRVYHEPVRVYAVDCDDDSGPAFHELAVDVALELEQEAVYVTAAPIAPSLVASPVAA